MSIARWLRPSTGYLQASDASVRVAQLRVLGGAMARVAADETAFTQVDKHLDASQLTLVAHDASGPPAIDWALANPGRVSDLVLLNTYYHWTPSLRRPPAIALYSTPLIRTATRTLVRWRPEVDRRLYAWQVGKFIQDPEIRKALVPQLYEQFLLARPAFWRLNDDLLGTVLTRRRRIPELRRFDPPVRIIFGARDRSLNLGSPATLPRCSRTASCTCWTRPGISSRSTSHARWPTSSSATRGRYNR